jgi:hypothetical protein
VRFYTFSQSRHLPLKYKERHTSRTSPLLSNSYNLLSWRTMLHNEELHNLYSSPEIIRQIKSGRMWWAGHVARMRTKTCTRFWWESPKERDHSEDQGVDGRMGSEQILGRWTGSVEWTRLAQDRDRWRATVNAVMNLRDSCATELVFHEEPIRNVLHTIRRCITHNTSRSCTQQWCFAPSQKLALPTFGRQRATY